MFQHLTPEQTFAKEDDARALQMLLRMGTVAEVDHASVPPRARIASGDLLTDFLPLPNDIGENFRRWRPVRVGTQVLLCCPGGDTRQGVIAGTWNTLDLPQPDTDPATDLVLFEDGTLLRKTPAELTISATVPVVITAPSVTINGTVF